MNTGSPFDGPKDAFGISIFDREILDYEARVKARREADRERMRQIAEENRRLRIERHERGRDSFQRLTTLVDELTIADTALAAVLKLHARRAERIWPECDHCVEGPYEAEPAAWPCDTVLAVANFYEIDVTDIGYYDPHLEKELHP